MTTEEMKKWVDAASYQQLLSKWRFAPAGDPFFQNEMGKYYGDVMAQRRKDVGDAAHVAASKAIGW